MKWCDWIPWSLFFECWILSQVFQSPLSSRGSLVSFSAIRVVSSAYLRLLIFLPAILIPAWASPSPPYCRMYSACKLNKQGDNIQPWRTPFPNWNQSLVPCLIPTVASWSIYRLFSTITCPFWRALHGMAPSFIGLDKAVVTCSLNIANYSRHGRHEDKDSFYSVMKSQLRPEQCLLGWS